MPPSINPLSTLRVCTYRPRASQILQPCNAVIGIKRPLCRTFADEKGSALPKAESEQVGPNMQQQEHVSEEAAKMAKITGGEGPDIEGQGTPVQDILKNDKDAREQAPQVMQESIKTGQGAANAKPSTNASGSRTFSTFARRRLEYQSSLDPSQHPIDPSMVPSDQQRAEFALSPPSTSVSEGDEPKGHKFPVPELPIPSNMRKDHRYDPLVVQITNLLMRDGKKAVAQRNMAYILNTLRTAPAPQYSPSRLMLPGAPPASHLPLDPVLYLTLAIDSVAPLLRIRSQKGAGGGGTSLQIPVPLGQRQRRRTAVMWILDVIEKKQEISSGKNMFAQKVANEIIAIVKGNSSVWDKRQAVHKLATTARTNVSYGSRGGRRR